MTLRFPWRLGLVLLLAPVTVIAQQPNQAQLLQSSAWSGTLTWTGDQKTESIFVEFGESSGKLQLRATGSREPCLATLQEMQRMSSGTVVFAPTQPERCDAPVKTLIVARSSETEVGLLMMSATDALSQGQLAMDNPSDEQLEDRATLKRPLPDSFDGYYRVSESGLLLKLMRIESTSQLMSESVEYRVVVPDAYAEDGGIQPGDLHARGRYLPLLAELSMSEVAIYLPEQMEKLSHCPPIFLQPINYKVANARRAERAVSSVDMLTMRAQGSRYCSVARTDPKVCRVVGCETYKDIESKKSLLLRDEVVARQLARVSRAAYEPDETYAEALADLRRRTALREAARQRARRGGERKGYFDRGGACGPISCEEEDTLQFIVDEYW